jgi:hypothetical protein
MLAFGKETQALVPESLCDIIKNELTEALENHWTLICMQISLI